MRFSHRPPPDDWDWKIVLGLGFLALASACLILALVEASS